MKTYIVDAFTSEPFKGNPAGICFPESPPSEKQMLDVAKELGFSETAFITSRNKDNQYDIRFFTPQSEIELCGHATLGSAKVMFEKSGLSDVHFVNVDGLSLIARRNGILVSMEFPVYDLVAGEIPKAALKAIGIGEIVDCLRCTELDILLVVMDSDEKLAKLAPDYNALVPSVRGVNGVLVTARSSDDQFDFVYRYFWPWKGTNEDPVTGGAQTFLAKYWGKILQKKKMSVLQSSARTGLMEVELIENDTRVLINGDAVIVLEGEMRNC